MKLVLLNKEIVSTEDLLEREQSARDEWHRADKAERRARARKRTAEENIRWARERLRLLRVLETSGDGR